MHRTSNRGLEHGQVLVPRYMIYYKLVTFISLLYPPPGTMEGTSALSKCSAYEVYKLDLVFRTS